MIVNTTNPTASLITDLTPSNRWWMKTGGIMSLKSGFSTSFGGCLGVFAAIVVIIILIAMLDGC